MCYITSSSIGKSVHLLLRHTTYKVDILYYKAQIVNIISVLLVIPKNTAQGSVPQHTAPSCMVYVEAARSKGWVCGRSLAGIVDSNPASGMDVCRECCVLSGGIR